jgi:hypothetical protein
MLKIFTIKYEERTESFNDGALSNFLSDKELLRWESHFFERKNEYLFTHYYTILWLVLKMTFHKNNALL